MSNTSAIGFDGVSRKTSFVPGLIALAHASRDVEFTTSQVTPNFPMTGAPKTLSVEPKTLPLVTMWSPAEHNVIASVEIAAMPVDVAIAASAPSSAARRCSNISTVGLVKRE